MLVALSEIPKYKTVFLKICIHPYMQVSTKICSLNKVSQFSNTYMFPYYIIRNIMYPKKFSRQNKLTRNISLTSESTDLEWPHLSPSICSRFHTYICFPHRTENIGLRPKYNAVIVLTRNCTEEPRRRQNNAAKLIGFQWVGLLKTH